MAPPASGTMATRHLIAALLFGLAQERAPATPATTVPAGPQASPIVPVATLALSTRPDQYAGATVSVTAAVAHVYGATASSIAQANSREGAPEILVVTPVLTAPLAPGASVTIIGDVIRFDMANLASRMKDAAPVLSTD